jgi:hypothetical protein
MVISPFLEEDSMISKPLNLNPISKLHLVVIAVFLFTAAPVLAQVTFTDNEAVFFTLNPNLAAQDFESGNAGPGSVVSCSKILNEDTNDACFSPGDILPGIEFSVPLEDLAIVGQGFGSNPFIVLIPVFSSDSMDITFPGNTVNAVGMDLGCLLEGPGACSNNVFVRVYGAGDELIGTRLVAVTDFFDSFLGIRSVEPITRINISNGDQLIFFEGIDRIAFGPAGFTANIPTLSEWGMIAAAAGLGLVGVFFAVRRKRLQASA